MKPVTIKLMQDCISSRVHAKLCARCGGSGKFRTIPKYDGLASSHGRACFDCGDLYKIPRGWTILDSKSKAAFIISNFTSLGSAQEFVSELRNVSIITNNEADEINHMILNIAGDY